MNIIYIQELCDAWGKLFSKIVISDEETDNVIVNDNRYSISYDDINEIKELLKNEDLSLNGEIVPSPVLDGNLYRISYGNKDIACYNLWYWKDEEPFAKSDIVTENDVKLTKAVIDLINKIQVILKKNNIRYNLYTGK